MSKLGNFVGFPKRVQAEKEKQTLLCKSPLGGWDGGIGWLVWGNGGNCWRESVSLTQWVGMITKAHCATGRTFIKDGDVEVGDQSRFVNLKSEKVFLFVLVYAERSYTWSKI